MTFLLPPGIKELKYNTVADLSIKTLKTLPTKQIEKSKVKLVKESTSNKNAKDAYNNISRLILTHFKSLCKYYFYPYSSHVLLKKQQKNNNNKKKIEIHY